MAKNLILTFASTDLNRSKQKLLNEAVSFNLFDRYISFDEFNIKKILPDSLRQKVNPAIRGCGYWSWKPLIILDTLRSMSDDDILLYLDAGCRLNINGKSRMLQYIDICKHASSGILAFQNIVPVSPLVHDGRILPLYPDSEWCKGDLIDYFGMRFDELIYTPTIGAGIIFIKKCDVSTKIISDWLNVILSDFSLIDDTQSASINLTNFTEHRHDQSIFSLLCKLNKVETLSSFEYWYPKKNNISKPDWEALKFFPIHALRRKDYGLIVNTTRLFSKAIQKICRYASC